MAAEVCRSLVCISVMLVVVSARAEREGENQGGGSVSSSAWHGEVHRPAPPERNRLPDNPEPRAATPTLRGSGRQAQLDAEAKRIKRAAERDDARSVERRCGKNQRATLAELTSPGFGSEPPWSLRAILLQLGKLWR